jgi:NitT/TauT family transport system substrate-binding protein
MRRTVGAALLALFAVLLASCSAPADGTQRITVVTTQPLESLTYAPEMVAMARGDFARHGLEVDLQALQGSPPALQSVLSGSAQLTRLGDVETMIAVGVRSAPLRVVGAEMATGPQRIVSAVDAPIRTPADLAGKTIGLPSLGGTSEATLNLVLARGGVDPASVQREVTGLGAGVFDLVAAGRVDAFVAPVDTAVVLQHSRPDAVILDTAQFISAGAQVYVSSTDQLSDPAGADRIARYLAAVHEAMDFVAADAATGYAETIRLIGSRYTVPSLADPATAKAGLDTYVALWGPLRGRLPPERWQEIYAEVSGTGIVPTGLDPGGWLHQLGPA